MKMVLATILERVDALLPSVDARPTRRGITLAPARGLPHRRRREMGKRRAIESSLSGNLKAPGTARRLAHGQATTTMNAGAACRGRKSLRVAGFAFVEGDGPAETKKRRAAGSKQTRSAH
jgi:hypothetical protein